MIIASMEVNGVGVNLSETAQQDYTYHPDQVPSEDEVTSFRRMSATAMSAGNLCVIARVEGVR